MAKQATEQVAANLLTEPANYDRIQVDGIHVYRLAEVIRAGAHLPAIIVDAQTLEIVDGVHRWKAYLEVNGPEGLVTVEKRTYKGFHQKFLESGAANAQHGKGLSSADMRHFIQLGEEMGIDLEEVRTALSITREKLTEFQSQYALTEQGRKIPLTRNTLHLAGQIIPDAQEANIRSAGGSSARGLARQLLRTLGSGAAEFLDEATFVQLGELYTMIGQVLAKRGAA